jgi:NAD(P)-dependent dehydrogenase (short-subunit alcohol dehydrogenase family)
MPSDSGEARLPEVVVVTGGSAGLGRAIVQAFAREGAHIGVLARDPQRLAETAAEVERLGGRALTIALDVSDAQAVEQAAERIERELGPIDVWVNNAMASVFSPVIEMPAEEFRRVTEVTYLGCVHGSLAALRRMLPRDRGVIIQVGSALAHVSIPIQSAYCAAKHAVLGFTISLRTELLHDRSNVRVTMVQMPALNTPQFDWVRSRLPGKARPIPPIFQPEVGARAVLYAARRDVGRELLVGWPTLRAVLGRKFAPWYVDRTVARQGYDSQQADDPDLPGRPDNLWTPVAGSFGAHGRFDAVAKRTSIEFWLRRQRRVLMPLLLAVVVVAALLAF